MSDESTTKPCTQCGEEISSTLQHCPKCGAAQEDAGSPDPVSTASSSFAIEDDDPPEQPAPAPAPAEPPSADVPAEEASSQVDAEVPRESESESEGDAEDISTATVRMSVADMGKAWMEETTGETGDAPPEPASPEPKRKGCLPVLALLIVLPAFAVVALLLG